MKNKTLFSKIMVAIIVAIVCILLTMLIALAVGATDADIFDLKNLNVSNMIPVILIGGFVSCVIVGIIVLFVAKDAFLKAKDYFFESDKDGGKKE